MRHSRILSGLVLSASMIGAVSCVDSSFLDETQTTDLSKEVIFSDSTYTVGFLNHIYTDITFDVHPNRFNGGLFDPGEGGLQSACDEGEFKVTSNNTDGVQFVTGTVNPVTISEKTWRTCYQQIRAVNVFLANADSSPMNAMAIKQYKAEARFLRAWYYFILLRHYGGVPLLGDVVYDNDNYETINMKRATFKECVDYIESECRTARADLPVRVSGVNYGRASGGACLALISRLKLYAASPLFNGTTHTDNPELKAVMGYPEADHERWKDAVDAARDMIATGMWDVYVYHQNPTLASNDPGFNEPGFGFYAQDHAADYSTANVWNGKRYPFGPFSGSILASIQGKGMQKCQLFDPPQCNSAGIPSGGFPTHDLVECFPMKDGARPGEGKYTYDRINPGLNRDPRLANTITYNGTTRKVGLDDRIVYTYKGIGATVDAINQGTRTGYYWRKGLHRSTSGYNFNEVTQLFHAMRYEEILLNYAEAVNEYYGPSWSETVGESEISPMEVLRILRERAGIEPGDDGNYGLDDNMDQNSMREAIRLERRIELACEGHRFFDVRRWMIADATENVMTHGLEITHRIDGTLTARVIDVRQHVFRKAMYFWPIPYNEVMRSSDLLQNPYYD